jgi:indole-3-glycerol phosphate synthase
MILEQIIEKKKKEVEQAKADVPLSTLIEGATLFIDQIRDFKKAIGRSGQINLIAEIKKASPSQGILRTDFAPVEIARIYNSCGAAALSILTEKNFFRGDIAYLKAVKEAVDLPILRKDFIIDKYQLYESACAGADAVLLIAQLLSKEELAEFYQVCAKLGLHAICEVHGQEDLDKALEQDFVIIGINNRNLQTLEVDLQVSAQLIKRIPEGRIVVSESGIKSFADIRYLQGLGVNAVLIGEIFMRSQDISAAVKEIMRC